MKGKLVFVALIVAASAILTSCTPSSGSGGESASGEATAMNGFQTVAAAEGCFIAAGTGGKIARLDYDNSQMSFGSDVAADLYAVTYYNGMYLAVGERGAITASDADAVEFASRDSGVKADLYAVAGFAGRFFAAGAGGTLLSSDDCVRWEKMDIGLENDIVTMAANHSYLFALTREGHIISSIDGANFSVQDYNTEFEGYNEHKYWFENITSLGETFFITGSIQGYEDVPMVMMSPTGEVWMPRAISEIDDRPSSEFLPLHLGQVGLGGGQLVAPVNGGRLISITDCSSCNVMHRIGSNEIYSLAYTADWVALAGQDFWFEVIETERLEIEEESE
ncbi:MAG: hypothetical protein LBH39_08585 [Clostridiales Family XIII bacterium]|jgi:hypothetical protein|nr:hypothetical protein [Clostridiales Family XIII bacterium]